MAIKFKYNEEKDTFTVKGLTYEHLEVLASLLGHTRLGNGNYANQTFELVSAIGDEFGDDIFTMTEELITFTRNETEEKAEKDLGSDVTINID